MKDGITQDLRVSKSDTKSINGRVIDNCFNSSVTRNHPTHIGISYVFQFLDLSLIDLKIILRVFLILSLVSDGSWKCSNKVNTFFLSDFPFSDMNWWTLSLISLSPLNFLEIPASIHISLKLIEICRRLNEIKK